ncbi:MAG: alpha/beta hydrolase family protein [Candidatus Xenobia bacterium]
MRLRPNRIPPVLLPLGLAAGGLLYWSQRLFPGRPFLRCGVLEVTSPDGRSHTAFVRQPAVLPEGGAPAVLMVHGGRGDNPFSARNFILHWTSTELVRLGYVVMSCDYRRYAFGGQEVEDVRAAARALAALPGVDAKRIVHYGVSHGAYIALMASRHETPAVLVSNWGPTDLVGMMEHIGRHRLAAIDGLVRETEISVRRLIAGTGKSIRESLLDLSPLGHVAELTCPILLVHGARDPIIPLAQAHAFYEAARGAGCQIGVLISESGGHDFALHGTERAREGARRTIAAMHACLHEGRLLQGQHFIP